MSNGHDLCFVFGGTQGIGLEVSRQLIASGKQVVIFARNAPKVMIGKDFFALDLSDPVACGSRIDEAVARYGAPRYVFNFVGRTESAFFLDHGKDDFEDQIRINYLSSVYLARNLVPHLLKRPPATLIFCSSLLGLFGHPGFSAYAASKHALTAFAECLRLEYGDQGLSVSVFCPPSTNTPGWADENKRKPLEILEAELRGGLLPPEKVASSLLNQLKSQDFAILPDTRSRFIVKARKFLPHRIWSRFTKLKR